MKQIAVGTLTVLLAAFFAFVGWNKAFAPLTDLAKYGSWTVHLPEWPGRFVGWSEMACAAALLLSVGLQRRRPVRFWAALILIANQLAAAAMHTAHGETGALPQNAVLIALLAVIVLAARANPSPEGELP